MTLKGLRLRGDIEYVEYEYIALATACEDNFVDFIRVGVDKGKISSKID